MMLPGKFPPFGSFNTIFDSESRLALRVRRHCRRYRAGCARSLVPWNDPKKKVRSRMIRPPNVPPY